MTKERAIKTVTKWVMEIGSKTDNYVGAYFSGSIIDRGNGEQLSPTSDIDVFVVLNCEKCPEKLGKFMYDNLLIEISYVELNKLLPTQELVKIDVLAGSFFKNNIIDDPTGILNDIHNIVKSDFSKMENVIDRRNKCIQRSQNGLQNVDGTLQYFDYFTNWLFSTAITTHAVLASALKNPTVRLRYLRTREVLEEYGYIDFYEELLELLHCSDFTRERVEFHMKNMEKAFDLTVPYSNNHFPFCSDISKESRVISIDGSYELIENGNHREAVFWIAATVSRCHKILHSAGQNKLISELMPSFQVLMSDLGVSTFDDIKCSAEKSISFLPKLKIVTDEIISRNKQLSIL